MDFLWQSTIKKTKHQKHRRKHRGNAQNDIAIWSESDLPNLIFSRNGGFLLPSSSIGPQSTCRSRVTNIELDYGKNYRKTLYLMVKAMVSCRFSLNPIQWNEQLVAKSSTGSTAPIRQVRVLPAAMAAMSSVLEFKDFVKTPRFQGTFSQS